MSTHKLSTNVTNLPDVRVEHLHDSIKKFSLPLTLAIVLTILAAWNLPLLGSLLPEKWVLMQATTALGILFVSTALMLKEHAPHASRLRVVIRLCAFAALTLALVTLFEHLLATGPLLAGFLVSDTWLPYAASTSVQSALVLALLASTLFIDDRARGIVGVFFDLALALLTLFILLFLSGYLFDAVDLIGESSTVLISLHTLLCVMLLTFIVISDRAPNGVFSVLVGSGIGSHIARMTLPYALLFSFFIIAIEHHMVNSGLLTFPYNGALTSVFIAVLLFGVIMMLARKINLLEKELRDMSLTDNLTDLCNHRGLYIYGEQKLREVHRGAPPVTLLFFDVDELKKVNDTWGHSVGSNLLRDVARLLKKNFRDADIVARIGGDEFVVVTQGSTQDTEKLLKRLDRIRYRMNRQNGQPYTISFSTGVVTVEPHSSESLDELLKRADTAMYEEKRHKYGRG